jgi:regulator of protease activity HflC (stomatin/prohibitin superfamily)
MHEAAGRVGKALVILGLVGLQACSGMGDTPKRDRVYRVAQKEGAEALAPFQSVEGLSLGVDVSVRYAIDPARFEALKDRLPADIDRDLVEPSVQAVIYKTFAKYTVKEIFSSKRAEIQQAIEQELAPLLAKDGIALRSVQMGKVDLPAEYSAGLERVLAEELATEKMKHTLVLREQMAQEQVIQAKAQEEAMKHILPLKQKQIQQRKLEADAEKQYRIRQAQGNAQARRIEAAGEADSRRKLADAESYRVENLAKVNSATLARDGELVTKYPLLIQKTMADKLSDNVSVIIAAPPANGSFIGGPLLGQGTVPVGAGEEGAP